MWVTTGGEPVVSPGVAGVSTPGVVVSTGALGVPEPAGDVPAGTVVGALVEIPCPAGGFCFASAHRRALFLARSLDPAKPGPDLQPQSHAHAALQPVPRRADRAPRAAFEWVGVLACSRAA